MANAPGQGRKSKSAHLKIVRGEKNKERINEKEPKPVPKRPPCPRFLDKEARKMWRYLAPQLERTGQLARTDLAIFASFCQVYSRWVKAERVLNDKGVLYKTGGKTVTTVSKTGETITKTSGGSVITSPMLWVANKCIEQFHKLGSSLGLDPASRSRIRVDLENAGDDFEDLLD